MAINQSVSGTKLIHWPPRTGCTCPLSFCPHPVTHLTVGVTQLRIRSCFIELLASEAAERQRTGVLKDNEKRRVYKNPGQQCEMGMSWNGQVGQGNLNWKGVFGFWEKNIFYLFKNWIDKKLKKWIFQGIFEIFFSFLNWKEIKIIFFSIYEDQHGFKVTMLIIHNFEKKIW